MTEAKWQPPKTLDELYKYIMSGVDEPDYMAITTPFGLVELVKNGPIVGSAEAIEWARVNYGKYPISDRSEQAAAETSGKTAGNDIRQLSLGTGEQESKERDSEGESEKGMEGVEGQFAKPIEDEGEGGDDASGTTN